MTRHTTPRPDVDDDDRPIGRFLSRREVLTLFGTSGAAVALAACAPGAGGSAGATSSTPTSPNASSAPPASTAASASAVSMASGIPSCVVIPELTEGPYYVDEKLERSDIRIDTSTDKAVDGAPLKLGWVVSQVDGASCVPLAGAIVDVWHCDATGVYSDVSAQGSTGHDFLRGYQKTDASGAAAFTTIYPGWYQGRAVHIHFKIRTEPTGTGFQATSQLFFDDALKAQVFGSGAYAAKGAPDTPNASDNIYGQSGGTTLLSVKKDGDGYAATFELAVKLA